MKKFLRVRRGWVFILFPVFLIIFVLIAFAFFNTILEGSESSTNIRIIVNYVLFLLGLIATFGVIFCIPYGIYLLVKKDHKKEKNGWKTFGKVILIIFLIGIMNGVFEKLNSLTNNNNPELKKTEQAMNLFTDKNREKSRMFGEQLIEISNSDNNEDRLSFFKEYHAYRIQAKKEIISVLQKYKANIQSNSDKRKIEEMSKIFNDFLEFEDNLLSKQISCEEQWIDFTCNKLTDLWDEYGNKQKNFIKNLSELSETELTAESLGEKLYGEELYNKLDSIDSKSDLFHKNNNKGLEKFSEGNYTEAILNFKKVLEYKDQVPKNSLGILYDNLALAYSSEENSVKAIEFYEKSLELIDEKNADYFARKGNINLLEKDYEDAIKNFEKALEIDSSNFYANNSLSSLYMGANDESYTDYQKALSHSLLTVESSQAQSKLTAKQNLALNYYFLEAYDKSLTLFKEIEKSMPNDALNKAYIGLIYVIKDDDRYKEYLKKAIELDLYYAEIFSEFLEE